MLRLFLAWVIIVSWVPLSFAQLPLTGVGPGGFGSAAAYIGPGNIVAGATAWWGLRAYTTAYATGLNKIANVCIPADVTCADLNSDANGNLVITTIGGSSCSVVTCTVKTLYDQTGNSNDITQATIASRPVLTVSCLGGKPCLTYVAGQSLVKTSFNGGVDVAQPFTIVAAVNDTGTSTGGGGILATKAANAAGLYANDGAVNTIEAFAGSSLVVTAANNTWHTFGGVFNDASSNMNVDGVDNTGAAGTRAFFNNAATLGSDPNGSNFVGTIAETGLWPSGLSSGNLSSLDVNASAYWGY